ncbi:MAG TPA: hypothetical protein DCK83_05915 [Gallionellaceae bacterium]|nr:hypothetical protein [Gallionellaceae bacterium]
MEVSIGTSGEALNQWNVPNDALARIGGKVVIFIQTAKGFRSETVTVLHEGTSNSTVSGKFKGDEKIAVRGISALKASLMGIGGE